MDNQSRAASGTRARRPFTKIHSSSVPPLRRLGPAALLGLLACGGLTSDDPNAATKSSDLLRADLADALGATLEPTAPATSQPPSRGDLAALDLAALPVAAVPVSLLPVRTVDPIHPAFADKLRDPRAYRVARSGLEDTCGDADDNQHVRDYDGTLGQPVSFVNAHRMPVGALESDADDDEDVKYCSGTLITRDLFLTASHCVDDITIGSDAVSFNYERLAGSTTVAAQSHFDVTEIVEDGNGGLDYAILRLAGNPGDSFGTTGVERFMPPINHVLTIIQHPQGEPKQVEVGHLHSLGENVVRYADLDTQGGSSGSGILDQDGRIVGVHTNGGCAAGDENFGTRIDRIAAVSDTIAGLLGPTILSRTARLSLLRIHDVGTGYGPPGDSIDGEVIVHLSGDTKYAYGFQLREDTEAETHFGMLRNLREAFRRNLPVRIEFERNSYSTNEIFRVIRQ